MEFSDRFPLNSWSRSRMQMLAGCPRKALFHYREARLGAADDAPELCRKFHARRAMLPVNLYIHRAFVRQLRQTFYQQDIPGTPQQLADTLCNDFDDDLRKMLCGLPRHAPLPVLKEIADGIFSPAETAYRVKERFHFLAGKLDKDLWKLFHTPGIRKRQISSPLRVQINELCCYCAPLFALENCGELWIVEVNADNCISLLHKFHAVNHLGRAPETVHSFSYTLETGMLTGVGSDENISSALRRIADDAEKWCRLCDRDPGDFPAISGVCPECQFYQLCQDVAAAESSAAGKHI